MSSSPSPDPPPQVAALPSLPPSHSLLDEVFSQPRPWSVTTKLEASDVQGSRRSSSASASSSYIKGKGKRTSQQDGDEDTRGVSMSTHESYPPMTDEAAETRRVEETLKRWELAERQRRKIARESVQYPPGPSILASVTRTASLVLAGRSAVGSSAAGQGDHRPLKSHESFDIAREGYGVPLDDIDRAHPSLDVTVHSPSPSVLERGASLDADAYMGIGAGMRASTEKEGLESGPEPRTSENPFEHPSERVRTPTPTRPLSSPLLSPFADAHAQAGPKTHSLHKRPSTSKTPAIPPPRPLGLPRPPEDIAHVTPPRPTPKPILRPPPREDPEERQEVRWWHEWLCGCGEGPDRGGDNQAGRTNPFE